MSNLPQITRTAEGDKYRYEFDGHTETSKKFYTHAAVFNLDGSFTALYSTSAERAAKRTERGWSPYRIGIIEITEG